jgi:hypothetical protein
MQHFLPSRHVSSKCWWNSRASCFFSLKAELIVKRLFSLNSAEQETFCNGKNLNKWVENQVFLQDVSEIFSKKLVFTIFSNVLAWKNTDSNIFNWLRLWWLKILRVYDKWRIYLSIFFNFVVENFRMPTAMHAKLRMKSCVGALRYDWICRRKLWNIL